MMFYIFLDIQRSLEAAVGRIFKAKTFPGEQPHENQPFLLSLLKCGL